jgi:aquaporin NIP
VSRYLGEFLGTFALVFAGTGAIIVNDVSGGVIGHAGIALTFGLIVMTMIYTVGDVSGAHLNPAVSLGFWIARRLPLREVGLYGLSQLMGALVASLVWKVIYPQHLTLGATLPTVIAARAFAMEIVLTFLLMFVIIHVSLGAKERGLMAGVAVGGIVSLAAMFAGPITGASMNPARSLAPALVSGNLAQVWIYLVAPFIGACLAILSCRLMRTAECCIVLDPEDRCSEESWGNVSANL